MDMSIKTCEDILIKHFKCNREKANKVAKLLFKFDEELNKLRGEKE